jgi:hypothetical protein
MQRRRVIVAVLLTCGPAWGQAPVGPATAVLNGTRFGLSAEYGQTDADVCLSEGAKERFDFRTAYAGLSAGLTSRWDLFLRLGGSQAEMPGFDGDWNVSWGLGTRITAFQWHDFSWGVLGQFTDLVSRFDPAAESPGPGPASVLTGLDKLHLMEYLFATGPTWQHGRLSLFGGLLVRYAHGELELSAWNLKDQADVDGRWDAGGYLGGRLTLLQTDPAQTYAFSRCDLVAEGRFTGASTGFSVGLLLPFGGAP